MAGQSVTTVEPLKNYEFPKNTCFYGYITNPSQTENASFVLYPMGSGKISKTLSPQQSFSFNNEMLNYVYNAGSVQIEIVFSTVPFDLSKSQAYSTTDIGQQNTYMKDDKIPSPLNMDTDGNIGIGLPTGAIDPRDIRYLTSLDQPFRSWILGTNDLPSRSWALGTGDIPSRSWYLGSTDYPDITKNQSTNLNTNMNTQSVVLQQIGNYVTQKAYYTYGGTNGSGFFFSSVASYPIYIRLKKLYLSATGNNDPSNQWIMAIFTDQTSLSPESYTNYDPISLMFNNRVKITDSAYYLATGTTSNGADTFIPFFCNLDYGVWLNNTESLYIEIGDQMFDTSNDNLYNVTMSVEYETNAPNSTSGYQVYPYEGDGWGSAIGSEDTSGSSILIR